MPVFSDRLCLVQPSSGYQIVSHQYALALTFPYLIRFLELDKKFRLSLYVEGRTEQSFSRHLQGEQPYFVLITSNTATFPHAVKLAKIAKSEGCYVILGGIFASMNAERISTNYPCFDKIIKGAPLAGMFDNSLWIGSWKAEGSMILISKWAIFGIYLCLIVIGTIQYVMRSLSGACTIVISVHCAAFGMQEFVHTGLSR